MFKDVLIAALAIYIAGVAITCPLFSHFVVAFFEINKTPEHERGFYKICVLICVLLWFIAVPYLLWVDDEKEETPSPVALALRAL